VGRDLHLKIYEGMVPAKDLLNRDPYVTVTVGDETVNTPVASDTIKPQWNWIYTFEDVTPDQRISFHVYGNDGSDLDDDLGQIQLTVGQLLYNNEGKRQTLRAGDSYLDVKGSWE
jgi:Ca2+-dependent lipid-binding protein